MYVIKVKTGIFSNVHCNKSEIQNLIKSMFLGLQGVEKGLILYITHLSYWIKKCTLSSLKIKYISIIKYIF